MTVAGAEAANRRRRLTPLRLQIRQRNRKTMRPPSEAASSCAVRRNKCCDLQFCRWGKAAKTVTSLFSAETVSLSVRQKKIWISPNLH